MDLDQNQELKRKVHEAVAVRLDHFEKGYISSAELVTAIYAIWDAVSGIVDINELHDYMELAKEYEGISKIAVFGSYNGEILVIRVPHLGECFDVKDGQKPWKKVPAKSKSMNEIIAHVQRGLLNKGWDRLA